MSTIMNFENFRNKLMEDLTHRFYSEGHPAQLRVCTIDVNNGQESKIEVKFEESKTGQYIPVRLLYSSVMDGEDYNDLLSELYSSLIRNLKNHDFSNDLTNARDEFEKKVFFRLVSVDLNKDMLLRVPHRIIEGIDLAITYRLMVRFEEGDGLASALIENENCEYSEEELYNMALKNTPIMFPEEFMSIWDKFDALSFLKDDKDAMYILGNKFGINGASVMAYPDCLKNVSEKMEGIYGNGDFYVLPSSIHEVIVFSSQTTFSEGYMLDVIREANSKMSNGRDILSHSLYFYKKDTGRLEIARTY